MRNDIDPGELAAIGFGESQADLQDVAERIADAARVIAPVRTGHYRDSIGTGSFPDPSNQGKETPAVVASDFKAWWVEFGAERSHSTTEEWAPFRKGAENLGFEVDEKRETV